jgi:hypothetical protein
MASKVLAGGHGFIVPVAGSGTPGQMRNAAAQVDEMTIGRLILPQMSSARGKSGAGRPAGRFRPANSRREGVPTESRAIP